MSTPTYEALKKLREHQERPLNSKEEFKAAEKRYGSFINVAESKDEAKRLISGFTGPAKNFKLIESKKSLKEAPDEYGILTHDEVDARHNWYASDPYRKELFKVANDFRNEFNIKARPEYIGYGRSTKGDKERRTYEIKLEINRGELAEIFEGGEFWMPIKPKYADRFVKFSSTKRKANWEMKPGEIQIELNPDYVIFQMVAEMDKEEAIKQRQKDNDDYNKAFFSESKKSLKEAYDDSKNVLSAAKKDGYTEVVNKYPVKSVISIDRDGRGIYYDEYFSKHYTLRNPETQDTKYVTQYFKLDPYKYANNDYKFKESLLEKISFNEFYQIKTKAVREHDDKAISDLQKRFDEMDLNKFSSVEALDKFLDNLSFYTDIYGDKQRSYLISDDKRKELENELSNRLKEGDWVVVCVLDDGYIESNPSKRSYIDKEDYTKGDALSYASYTNRDLSPYIRHGYAWSYKAMSKSDAEKFLKQRHAEEDEIARKKQSTNESKKPISRFKK